MITRFFCFSVAVFCLFSIGGLNAQDSIDYYTVKPIPGVYMSVYELRNNSPSYKIDDLFVSRYVTDFTIAQWSRSSGLLLDGPTDLKKSLRDSIYAISENGVVQLFIEGRFHKIQEFGSLCYFKEYYNIHIDPMIPVVTNVYGTVEYRILDLGSGNIYDYNISNLELLLLNDPQLLKEFRNLKKKKRKKLIYLYIEKYNDRNPWMEANDREAKS